jgi:cytochrome b subunit of formate dehydrogenase
MTSRAPAEAVPARPARANRFVGVVGLAVFVGLAALATVPVAAAPTPDQCMMCHKDPGLAKSVGRQGSLFVDVAALQRSTHASLSCVDCHTDASSLSHAPRLAPVRCARCHAAAKQSLSAGAHRSLGAAGTEVACTTCHGIHDVKDPRKGGMAVCARCHAQEVAVYATSVHGVAHAQGDSSASTCQDCHGSPHGLLAHTDPAAPTNRAHAKETCARCHADRRWMSRKGIAIPAAVQLFRGSVHGRSAKLNAAQCIDCHGAHGVRRAADPLSALYRSNIPGTCGQCHMREVTAYRVGVHGTALRRGVTDAPVCTDCHGEHMIQGPKDVDSPVAAAHVTETCSRCHEATGIRRTYGLPASRLATYRDSYHGLAARGGSPVVANCASCHGFHDILPSSDPRSSIAAGNLGRTCGRCHPGVEKNKLMGPIHVVIATSREPALFWARIIYLWLIAGTIGFMLLHNALDFVRKLRRHLAEQMGRVQPHAQALSRWFVRMTALERLQHTLLAVSFFTLVYTGFALKYPEAWGFHWLAKLEGGYAWRSIIHRVAAVAMVVTSLFHVGYLLTRRGRRLVFDLFPRVSDAFDLMQNMLYLVGLRSHPARFDRFGYIEKAEYWALIWGTMVMTVTGGVLWFENSFMQRWPKWILDLATVVHFYEAWLAFLAIVVWHLYQNIVNPDVYPMNWTWLTGKISEDQLRHEHYREWEREVGAEEEPVRAPAAVRGAEPAPGGAAPAGGIPEPGATQM